MVLKNGNHFLKIKKEFSLKRKIFSLTIILHCTKHNKIQETFFRNHFTSKYGATCEKISFFFLSSPCRRELSTFKVLFVLK
jgi:heterodisulfide reductase subunit C